MAIKQIEKLSWDWIKMDCSEGRCYGLLAVSTVSYAFQLASIVLKSQLVSTGTPIRVCSRDLPRDTRSALTRCQINKGETCCCAERVRRHYPFNFIRLEADPSWLHSWWGPKLLSFFLLSFLAFLVPNEFFMFYGRWIVPIGAFFFILIGLVLLVDFAHTWSETCLDRWESSETQSNLWQFVLVGSTFGLYLGAIVMTTVLYIFFAGSGCGTNTFFITFNLILSIAATLLSIAPPVQEANPKSGLAQASMVAAYCTYLTASAVANHNDDGHGECNPLHRSGTKKTTILLGALFTFLAIAYSTSRAATQSKALVGKGKATGPIALPDGDGEMDGSGEEGHVRMVVNQPKPRKDEMRYQAIKAAVDAG
jgi:hypothetical protein